jgi:two-component system, OmpR family, sensor kinase
MGLAIVQEIVKAHGGTLRVASAPETGTTFTMSFPRGGVQ